MSSSVPSSTSPEEGALRTRLEAAESEVDSLRAELALRRKLPELVERLVAERDERALLTDVTAFAVSELGYPRAVALAEGEVAGTLRALASAGSDEASWLGRLSALELTFGDVVVTRVLSGAALYHTPQTPVDEVAPLAEQLGLGWARVQPLREGNDLRGLLVVGGVERPDADREASRSEVLAAVGAAAGSALGAARRRRELLEQKGQLERRLNDRNRPLRPSTFPGRVETSDEVETFGPSSRILAGVESMALPPSAYEVDGARILVVDDDEDIRNFTVYVLSKRYQVIEAEDGVEGLELARQEHPDMIVSDVSMPRMNGYELCEAVRLDAELSRTPFVLLSAGADMSRKLEGLDHGADDYLIKPFNASELMTRVRNLVRMHFQSRALMDTLRMLEERERDITEDLQQAREFQQSMLPPPPAIPGMTADILYHPLGLVGGDIYDIQLLPDGRLRVFLADAAGHGVQASLSTMLIKSEYEFVKQGDLSPAEILKRLNDRLTTTYPSLSMRFTAACFEVDPGRQLVRCAGGAHPSPLLVHDGEVRELTVSGPFLGMLPGITFEQHESPFTPGDRVYLYTDGITEEWNSAGEDFGEQRLFQALAEATRQQELAGPPVYEQVCRFIEGGRDQYDDMTLLGVWWGQPSATPKERQ